MRAVIVGMLVPASLAAQSAVTLTPFASRNGALPEAPYLFGLSAARYSGPLGLRIGGAAGKVEMAASTTAERSLAWTGDADLILSPGNVSGLAGMLGGWLPAGFVGIGMQGVHEPNGTSSVAPVWSYGAALSRSLIGPVGLESEARYRAPIDGREGIPEGFARNWDYRLGLVVRFGGRDVARSRATAGGAPRGTGGGLRVPPLPRSPHDAATARRVLLSADRHVGVRYRYGGSAPSTGFDCSGFVQFVFRDHGIALPRTSRQMALAGEGLVPTLGALRPGDLMFFAQDGTRIDHVAIYAGEGRIIHSSSSGNGVRYDDLSKPRGRWFVQRWVAARRVVGAGTDFVSTLRSALRMIEALDPPDHAPIP